MIVATALDYTRFPRVQSIQLINDHPGPGSARFSSEFYLTVERPTLDYVSSIMYDIVIL